MAVLINIAFIFVVSGIAMAMNSGGLAYIAALAFLAIPFTATMTFSDMAKERNSPENVAARAAKQAEWEAQQAELEAQRYAKLYAEGKIILEVKFLGNGTTLLERGGLGDYLWGDFVAGPVGGVIAASAVKGERQLLCFAVLYSDRHIEIEQVLPNSKRFNELLQYVKWEEIE